MELVEILNLLYSAFDEIILDWGVHKVAPRCDILGETG